MAGGALVGATLTSGRLAAADYTVRLAHSLSATEPAHLAAEFFAKNVTERTTGKVQVPVFPGEQLGTGKDVNEMIRQGSPVMNLTDPGYLSDYVPDVGVLNGPYLLIKDPRLRQASGLGMARGAGCQTATGGLSGDCLELPSSARAT